MGVCNIKIETNDLRQIGYTSLDTIQGKVNVDLRSGMTLNCIQIKLTGVAQTALEGRFSRQNDRITRKEEQHLVLNETKTVFPLKESNQKELVLGPGQHEFAFNLKIPLNNACYDDGKTNSKSFKMLTRSDSNLSGSCFKTTYHDLHILPPSMTELCGCGSIQYQLKVTIKRSSLLKSNFTKIKTIRFTQFNGVDHLNRARALNYVRKECIFKDKLPEIIAIIDPPKTPPQLPNIKDQPRPTTKKRVSGLRLLFFGSDDKLSTSSRSSSPKNFTPQSSIQRKPSYEPPTIIAHDVPFFFEARSYGFLQTIGQPISLNLYILTRMNPQKFLGIDGESSGLGSIYLKSLHIELVTITYIRAQTVHQSLEKHTVLCSVDTTTNLDLSSAKASKAMNENTGNPLYELKIPQGLYGDLLIPGNLTPSFKTCNIERRYKLLISAKFAETKCSGRKSFKTVALECNITLLSGISPPFASETAPPTTFLPSYEEVVRQSS